MSLFKKPSELEVNPTIKMLVYGQPGLGKSTLALSAPSPVLLDFDGGVQRVNGAFQCPTLQVHSWDEVVEALGEDLSPFRTIVIDTVGKMLDYMSAYIVCQNSKMANRDGSLSLKGYGARKMMFIDFIKRCSLLGKHLVFVAHEREDKDGDVRIVRPEIGGSSAGDLMKELDLVGYMQAIGTDRTISWTPQEKFYAKNTCNLPAGHRVATIINEDGLITGKNDFLTLIFKQHEQYLLKQKDVQVTYDNLMAQVEDDIAAISDVDTANAVMQKVLSYTHIWDSKARASVLINTRCKSLGLTYNKALGKYESAA